MAVLQFRAVSKQYESVRALDGCTFQAVPGRLTGFVGPNGAGKTTAMRVILGLVSPDSGQILWRGHPIAEATRRRFGYMPEERGLYPRMRIGRQLMYFGRLAGMSGADAARAADRWLTALGLADRAAARLDDLSHGNQQRVQLAAALLHDPELAVLDEPFSGLDPFAMDSMSALLKQVAESGAAVLFSSHQLDVVQHLCDDVVVIDSGRVVLAGRLDEIRESATDRYLDVTAKGDLHRLTELAGVSVVASDDGHVRLRVPRGTDAGMLLQAAGHDVMRVSYEPPTLSELFRRAVAESREPVSVGVHDAS